MKNKINLKFQRWVKIRVSKLDGVMTYEDLWKDFASLLKLAIVLSSEIEILEKRLAGSQKSLELNEKDKPKGKYRGMVKNQSEGKFEGGEF